MTSFLSGLVVPIPKLPEVVNLATSANVVLGLSYKLNINAGPAPLVVIRPYVAIDATVLVV